MAYFFILIVIMAAFIGCVILVWNNATVFLTVLGIVGCVTALELFTEVVHEWLKDIHKLKIGKN